MAINTREIRDMISTATIGDGDQVLNILEKVCDALNELQRQIDHVAEVSDNRAEVVFRAPFRGSKC